MTAHKPLIIGLTGNIATGKSTVLRYFAQRGAQVIDADQLTHRAMAPDGPAYAAVLAAFGANLARADRTIDRAALGRIVFADPAALARLEALIHPAVFQLAQAELATSTAPLVIIEAIKLLEAKSLSRLCDEIWVVTASPATQLARLHEHRGMSEAEAQARMAAQSSQAEKVKQADRVIDNDGSVVQLEQQLARIWLELEPRLKATG